MSEIVIDSTRISASIYAWGVFKSSTSAYCVRIPVTVGYKYTITWNETDSALVGSTFRWGFTGVNTVSNQHLRHWVRTSPQSAPSVELVAHEPYLIIEVDATLASNIFDNDYISIEETVLITAREPVDMMLRRRENLYRLSFPEKTANISWSGAGADRTSSLINATDQAVYWKIPFVSGGTGLESTATASSNAERYYMTTLYRNSSASVFVGYYNPFTNKILNSKPITSKCPWIKFDTEVLAVPQGYYGKISISRAGDAFSSNANRNNYINAYAKTVTFRSR